MHPNATKTVTRNHLATRMLVPAAAALLFAAGCGAPDGTLATSAQGVESTTVRERSWDGAASHQLAWARAGFDATMYLYLYEDGSQTFGTVHPSTGVYCGFQGAQVAGGLIQIPNTACSGGPAGLSVALECDVRADGGLRCSGVFTAPGRAASGVQYEAASVTAPDGRYGPPEPPRPRHRYGGCYGVFCGAGCCPPHYRCGSGSCHEVLTPEAPSDQIE